MNNPNPFVPQGSLLEQSKRRSRMKLAVFCVLTVSVAGLTAMLIQGCKRETDSTDNSAPTTDTNNFTADTNSSPLVDTNPPVSPIVTNLPTVVTPPPVETTTEYVVVKGDSFSKIAKKSGVSIRAISDANPGVESTKLKVGQKLSIPAATGNAVVPEAATTADSTGAGEEIYSVKSGDTLTKIARQYSTTVKAIESENNLTTTKIKVGQKLKIPAKAEASTPAPASEPMPAAPASVTPVPSSAAPTN
jgi:LysM repeat protein